MAIKTSNDIECSCKPYLLVLLVPIQFYLLLAATNKHDAFTKVTNSVTYRTSIQMFQGIFPF